MAEARLIDRVIRGMEGPRSYTFRYERRDVNGVFKEDVSAAFLPGGEIRLDNDGPTLRTARFVVDVDTLPANWNYGDDFVQVYLDLLMPGGEMPGGEIVPFPLGLFQLTQPDRTLSLHTHRTETVQGSDLNDRFARDKLVDQVVATTATDAITTLLGDAGLRSSIGYSELGGGLWPPISKSRRDTAFEIAFSGVFYAPWPDEVGVFRMTPKVLDPMLYEWDTDDFAEFTYTAVDLARAGTHVTYSMSGEGAMVLQEPKPRITTNLTQGANRAILTDEVPPLPGTAGTLVVTMDNNDLSSPINQISTEVRTLNHPLQSRIGELAMFRYGPYELADADSRSTLMRFATPIDPRRTAHEYYQITGSDQLPSDASGWKVRSWQLPLTVGAPMLHEVTICRPVRLQIGAVL